MYRSAVGYGEVEIVDDFEGKKQGLKIIIAQHGATEKFDFSQKQVEKMVILKLTINSVTGKQSSNWDKEH